MKMNYGNFMGIPGPEIKFHGYFRSWKKISWDFQELKLSWSGPESAQFFFWNRSWNSPEIVLKFFTIVLKWSWNSPENRSILPISGLFQDYFMAYRWSWNQPEINLKFLWGAISGLFQDYFRTISGLFQVLKFVTLAVISVPRAY